MKIKSRIVTCLVALVTFFAPVASETCWGFFHEEEEPKNHSEFLKKIQEENRK